ncbi:DUF6397 family protein [Streptomyces sp. NPDC056716]|uniref:DUF6397 family protein n=1 Tax=unclassified Streptomyces TaxID=2593676 RepID=UPI0036B29107
MSGNTIARPDSAFWTISRAARELGLKRIELELGVRLGRVRSVPDPGGGGRRVTRAEIDRLRAEDGFPQLLREGIRAVAAPEGGKIMDVPSSRLTRLAKLGLLVPVSFYFNRYRALVWLYLADELRQFATDERNAGHLKGRFSEGMRSQLDGGLDLRPRNWRGRHLGLLLRQSDDPWTQAAAIASILDQTLVSDLIRDPYEHAHLNRFRPVPPTYGSPGSPTADLASDLMTASDLDEIDWLRTDLAQALAEARDLRPAPRSAPRPTAPTATPAPPPTAAGQPRPDQPGPGHPPAGRGPSRGLLGWLRRRSP